MRTVSNYGLTYPKALIWVAFLYLGLCRSPAEVREERPVAHRAEHCDRVRERG